MRSCIAAAYLFVLPAVSFGQEWPQFRGPGSTGLAEKSLPVEWSGSTNLAWKIRSPGAGLSSPIVWGDKIFLTTADAQRGGKGTSGKGPPGKGKGGNDAIYRFQVHCLDRHTGKVLWSQLVLESKPRVSTGPGNTYATETPVTDGERVYAYFGMHAVACFDFQGKLQWKKDLGAYTTERGHGTASSPVLDGERLFLQIDNEEKSFVVALDAKTGDEMWRIRRDETTNYCSPVIWKNKLRTELVVAGTKKVCSYDPASGKIFWELSLSGGGRCPASPVGDTQRLYVGGGGSGPGGKSNSRGTLGLFAINAGASGDITLKRGESSNPHIAWAQPRGDLENASPIVYQGFLYVFAQRSFVSCYDAKTGMKYYRERLNAGDFWASPWACDGKVFCIDQNGTTSVIAAGPEFKVIRENSIRDQFFATPAITRGAIILRGTDSLYCIHQGE